MGEKVKELEEKLNEYKLQLLKARDRLKFLSDLRSREICAFIDQEFGSKQ